MINSLFEAWYPSLLSYGVRLAGSVDAAEDAIQDAFFELYRALRAGRTIDNPKGWVLVVVRRTILKAAGQPERSLESLGFENRLARGWLDPAPEVDDVSKLLSVLSRREEEVVLLRMEMMQYREIGTALGIGVNTVKTLLARALRKLRATRTGTPDRASVSSHVERHDPKTLQ